MAGTSKIRRDREIERRMEDSVALWQYIIIG